MGAVFTIIGGTAGIITISGWRSSSTAISRLNFYRTE